MELENYKSYYIYRMYDDTWQARDILDEPTKLTVQRRMSRLISPPSRSGIEVKLFLVGVGICLLFKANNSAPFIHSHSRTITQKSTVIVDRNLGVNW